MERFLSCDWGTSTFRLRLSDTSTGEAHAELIIKEGIAETYQQWVATRLPEPERVDFYRRKLMDAVRRLQSKYIENNMPVILSGMASSAIGMVELPYREFPFSWDLAQFPVKKIDADEKFSHPLYLVSGFKTEQDVMRGEESLLLGCDISDDYERIFIFPGTHCKHVFVKNKTGTTFQTYMTGEFFQLLAEKSILRHAVAKGPDEKSFAEGIKAGSENNLLHDAFMIRTRQLLHHANPSSGYQFLSGLLIGAELSQLKKNHYPVYVVCSEHLKQAYLTALELMGFGSRIHYLDADKVLLKAHRKIAEHILKQSSL